MMLLDLICIECIMEQIEKGVPHQNIGEAIMTPFEKVNNTGIYEVNCSKGHKSNAIIDNIDFEILFEYGLNAIADGYYREAVSSLTASLERYYEFFVKTILIASNTELSIVEKAWKVVSNQSERQLGAYIFLYSLTFGKEPQLLNSNKEVPFRNKVIHKGYIPNKEDAINYGDKILELIENSLIELKNKYPNPTKKSFETFGYKKVATEYFEKLEKDTGVEQKIGCVNIMTTIDVMHGREMNHDDGRKGNVDSRIKDILERREPRTLILLKDKPKK